MHQNELVVGYNGCFGNEVHLKMNGEIPEASFRVNLEGSNWTGKPGDFRHRKSEPTIRRRNSSFTSLSSPWFRRKSLLSRAMAQNENFSVYESPSYFTGSSYNIISLRESQGFVFNQDLFASPYQQQKSQLNERRLHHLRKERAKSNLESASTSLIKSDLLGKPFSSLGTTLTPADKEKSFSFQPRVPVFSPKECKPLKAPESHSMFDLHMRDEDESGLDHDELRFGSGDVSDSSNRLRMELVENESAIADEYEDLELAQGQNEDINDGRLRDLDVTEIVVNENDNTFFPI